MKRKTPRRKHEPTVILRKLGRERAWGLASKNGTIELDPRLSGLAKLEILIHEYYHIEKWDADETEVERRASRLAKFLHKNHIRIIEPGNKPAP